MTAEIGWEVAQKLRSCQNQIVSSSEIVNLDAVALSRAIKSKQVSCVEVMNAYLDQIDRLNPRVNAIVSLQPRDELARAGAELATRNSRAASISAGCTAFRMR